jgi:hypothetical protein
MLAVDRARSSVVAIADVAGFLGFLGHSGTRFSLRSCPWSSSTTRRPRARSRVEVRVPTCALRIDSREAIASGRVGSRPDPETVDRLQTTMLSPRVLDGERYPTIEFSGTGVEPDDGGFGFEARSA